MSAFLGSVDLGLTTAMGTLAVAGLFGIEFLDGLFGTGQAASSDDEPEGPDEADPFEAFEDEWDDDWVDDQASQPTAPDIEPRIEDLESEVERLSTTVSTVRSENEALAESVEEIEENVRKLLGIYEAVSREANPFVDEEDRPGPDAAMGSSETDELFEQVTADLELDDEAAGTGAPEDGHSHEPDARADNGAESMTFEDLKAEYQAESADATDDFGSAGPVDTDTGAAEEPMDPDGSDGSAAGPGSGDAGLDPVDPPRPAGSQPGDPGGDRQRSPHLATLPDGYVADVLVLDWMTYLQRRAGSSEVVQAVEYYQRIGWIAEPVADRLRTVVEGLDARATDPDGSVGLTVDDHARSLEFISRLDGDPVGIEVVSDRTGE